ncbi:MAG: putative photosynthetic complex assembly protein PuhE [Steroidobacteraceae bacterium]
MVAAAYAVVVWWFTTGAILLLDRLDRATFRWSMCAATIALGAAGYLVYTSAFDVTAKGAYVAFTCAIVTWGWLEMSFLMGFITGPRTHACAERCSGWSHFRHAAQAIIYNEIATVAGAAAIVAATHGAPNQVALWTYALLWAMRLSAKFNLFLGVPNLGEKFLPEHLLYLKSFFRKRPMNGLFPVSVTVATLLAARLLQKHLSAADDFQAVGYALLSSLSALALIEHWFMVLPLPNEKLWMWALKSGRGAGGGRLERRLTVKAPIHP